ncbi:alanine dehydrogenase [Baekduia soli]|uniref:alanine dehydrogenase n=1 Tax=Baekduia soli TaxID=496014 RepID=UPI001E5980CB|nr:alanine dehydrogenase [Baekduia soli]
MKVGVPTEIKTDEYRVALTPAGVRELVDRGHEVLVQAGAGVGSAIADEEYVEQGAQIVGDAAAVFAGAEMIVKVKEPQAVEVAMLRPDHVVFTYLHLAPDPVLTRGLMDSGATCVAYETVTDRNGRLPLLAPMSEVAGKIATQAGAFMLEKPLGGRGLLLGGVPGVAAGKVMVIGGGVVGLTAAEIAIGMGAETYIYDRSIDRLRELDFLLNNRCSTVFSTTLSIERMLPEVDLVIGAVLVHGAKAPHVITRAQLGLMKQHAVLVDVSIDQGGCFETSRPTTHSDPTYEVDGVTHYCVANMPGAVPITSTFALTNATMPYIVKLADQGVRAALGSDPGFMAGLNVAAGRLTYAPVAGDQGLEHTAPEDALALIPTPPREDRPCPSTSASAAAPSSRTPRRPPTGARSARTSASTSARAARRGRPPRRWRPRTTPASRRSSPACSASGSSRRSASASARCAPAACCGTASPSSTTPPPGA